MNNVQSILRRLKLPTLLAAAVTVAACKSPSQSSSVVARQYVAADASFDAGANRPPTAETLYRLAKLLEAQGKDEHALAAMSSTIDRYPDYIPAYCGLAAMQVRQRRLPAATATLERALQVAPNDPIVLNDLGMVWMLREDHHRALNYFTRAAEIAPDDARFRANQALATGMLGRYDDALELYLQVLAPARAHYNVAIIAESRDDRERADEEFARANELDRNVGRQRR